MANPGTENRLRNVQIGLRLSSREKERLEEMVKKERPGMSVQEFIRWKLLGNENEGKRSIAHGSQEA